VPKGAKPTHGHSSRGKESRTYIAWKSMRARMRPNFIGARYYSGRGIVVCARWLKFENFLADMGEKPDGLTLERIDNDGNYELSNCRWATRAEQSRNRRVVKLSPTAAADIRAAVSRQGQPGNSMYREMAEKYGVGISHINKLRLKKSRNWR